MESNSTEVLKRCFVQRGKPVTEGQNRGTTKIMCTN